MLSDRLRELMAKGGDTHALYGLERLSVNNILPLVEALESVQAIHPHQFDNIDGKLVCRVCAPLTNIAQQITELENTP